MWGRGVRGANRRGAVISGILEVLGLVVGVVMVMDDAK